MENLARKTFDFSKEKVQVLTLDELKRTYNETDIWGKPLRGMYHHQIIENVYEILLDNGLQAEINEIFAAQNGGKTPGVVKSPELEAKYGEGAIEAHVLRRVYADLNVRDYDNEELTTNVVVAFHQDNVQLAYGPMVKICHNQCILSPERVITTSRQNGINDILRQFSEAMKSLGMDIERDKEFISRMKEYKMTANQLLQTIGIFTTMRVQHDTLNKSIKVSDTYPLNDSQISTFTEDLLVLQSKQNEISLWDMYNVATNLYKANKMSIPSMFPQHLALNNYVHTLIG